MPSTDQEGMSNIRMGFWDVGCPAPVCRMEPVLQKDMSSNDIMSKHFHITNHLPRYPYDLGDPQCVLLLFFHAFVSGGCTDECG